MRSLVTRSAATRPNSWDPDNRTFEAVIATAAPVKRGGYIEVLDLAGVETPDSLPLQLDHRADVKNSVGKVSALRVDDSALVGVGRVSSDPSLDWLGARIADGTIAGLSVGFAVSAWRKTRNAAGHEIRTATRWRPVEVSLVSQPADSNCGIRSMNDEVEVAADEAEIPVAEDRATRNRRIRTLCRSLSLPRTFEDEALDSEWDSAEFNSRALTRLAERGQTQIRAARSPNLDDPAVYDRALVDALVVRMTGAEAEGPARDLAGLSWAELHRRHLRARGVSTAGLSDQEIITRALTTSDLPLLAGAAFNQTVRQTYEAAASPINQVIGSRTVPDFRPWRDVTVDWTTLSVDKVNEHGEFKHSYVSETGEVYSLFTIGGITDLTRQVWINGGQALADMSRAQGRRLAADVADRAVAFLTQATGAGPTMADGNPVFHSSRGNIATLTVNSPLTVIDGILAVRAAMPRRTGKGNVTIGVLPRFWLVPPEFEPTALRALAEIQAADAASVNPLSGKLELLVEPRLTNVNRSYLVAAPAAMEGMVKVGLEGAPGPVTESRWEFERDVVAFKIRLDLGHGFVEWRSWTRLDHVTAP